MRSTADGEHQVVTNPYGCPLGLGTKLLFAHVTRHTRTPTAIVLVQRQAVVCRHARCSAVCVDIGVIGCACWYTTFKVSPIVKTVGGSRVVLLRVTGGTRGLSRGTYATVAYQCSPHTWPGLRERLCGGPASGARAGRHLWTQVNLRPYRNVHKKLQFGCEFFSKARVNLMSPALYSLWVNVRLGHRLKHLQMILPPPGVLFKVGDVCTYVSGGGGHVRRWSICIVRGLRI